MISEEESKFYSALREDIRQHPEWLMSAVQAIHAGMEHRLRQERHEKSEWETIAFNAMEARIFKNNKMWLSQKIDRLNKSALFKWDYIIERLRK
jgi:hypothetical protein